jgi:hypothetical protein
MWFDIRCAAGEQQSVAGSQQGLKIERSPEGGYEHRDGFRSPYDRLDIFLTDHVEVLLPIEPAIGWNSDERQARHV